jgi:hypothetical protein
MDEGTKGNNNVVNEASKPFTCRITLARLPYRWGQERLESNSGATSTGLLQVIRLELLILLPVQTNPRIQHQHSGSSQMIENSHRLEDPSIVRRVPL